MPISIRSSRPARFLAFAASLASAACGDASSLPPESESSRTSQAVVCGTCATDVWVGIAHNCALLTDERLKCWGYNGNGQLGLEDTANRGDEPGDMGSSLPAVDLGPGQMATSVATGGFHTCAILGDGTVKCWGDNTYGQLGLGDTASRGDEPGEMGSSLLTVDLGSGRRATAIAAGTNHTCAILDNGTVKCWGHNGFGQLGLGEANNFRGDAPGEMGDNLPAASLAGGRTPIAIAAGDYHNCALLDNNRVKCWGDNTYGQLGLGDTNDRGDQPGEMGNNLPYAALGTVLAISTEASTNCALVANNKVRCWGDNTNGRLGLGDTNNRGDEPNEMGANLPYLALGRPSLGVGVGTSHSCALLDNNKVKCWGGNHWGHLGLGDTEIRGDEPGEMGGALPYTNLGRPVSKVSPGFGHSCAVLDNNRVRCWGVNGNGRLGLGDSESRGDQPNEMGNNLPVVQLN